MDDYAHHPTEVRATIAAAIRAFPERRLIGVYQPHTYSRISYLWDEWLTCWTGLEALVVLETYAARETPLRGRSAATSRPRSRRADASTPPTSTTQRARRANSRCPGDVIFTIGAGDVVEVGPQILELLR